MNTFEKGVVFSPANTVEYAEGSVVSREILRNNAGTLTLLPSMLVKDSQNIPLHFDATVTILDGEAEITVGWCGASSQGWRNAHHACWCASCPPSSAAFQDAPHHDSWLGIPRLSYPYVHCPHHR